MTNKRLIGVITAQGALILKSRTPWNLNKGYPCHVIDMSGVGLTTGDLRYWLKVEGSTPVYLGDTVTVKF